MSESAPTSTKPYLVRAIHEWCTDNGLTPYIAVSVTDAVRVPREHVRDGEIVLNIGMLATDKLSITNDEISFYGRFSGRVHEIFVPMDSIAAIYAKETGNGMAFEVTKPSAEDQSVLEEVAPVAPSGDEPSPKPPAGRPRLTRVK